MSVLTSYFCFKNNYMLDRQILANAVDWSWSKSVPSWATRRKEIMATKLRCSSIPTRYFLDAPTVTGWFLCRRIQWTYSKPASKRVLNLNSESFRVGVEVVLSKWSWMIYGQMANISWNIEMVMNSTINHQKFQVPRMEVQRNLGCFEGGFSLT